MELVGQLCPGDQVSSEGQKAIHPLTWSLQKHLPQLLLLRCGIHPGYLEPVAAAWIYADRGEGHGYPGHPRSQGMPAGSQITHCHSQLTVDIKAQGRVEKCPRPHTKPGLSIRSPGALPHLPVPRLRRVPPSWRLVRAPWSQRESSAQA